MIKYILVLFCLFLELPLVRASAQDLELNRRESAFSEQVQSQLQQILSGYYKDDTYLVNVKSHLERIPERKTAPETTEVMELPGLPVSPSLSPKKYVNEQWLFTDRFRVKYIEITVLVNKEIFTSEDITFIDRVVKMNPDIDTARGDRVRVVPLNFPVAVQSLESVEEDMPAEQKTLLASLYPYLYVSGGILLFLLIVIILLQIISLKKTKKPDYEYGLKQSRLPKKPYTEMIEPVAKPAGLPMAGGEGESFINEKSENDKNLFYELRQLMVTTLIGNPELSGDIFKKWIDVDKDEGVYKLAAFFKATDPKLTEFLSEYLGTELTAKVEFAMNQVQSVDKDSLIEVFKKFREEFQSEQSLRIMKKKETGEEGDIFQFLNQLNPHQIFQLVKDEPLGIIAVVLAQVPPEIANEVINNLPEQSRLKIPVEIGKLKKIPISTYSDIAKKLSKKAVEFEKIKYVTTDGVNALIEMLEQSSPEAEEQLLASVAEHDIALAEELRKVYISFDELTILPDMIISDVMRGFSREVITRALINSRVEIRDKIVSNLPPRTKIMVTDALDAGLEEVPIEEISKARHLITRKFRVMAKSGKIDLAKYVK